MRELHPTVELKGVSKTYGGTALVAPAVSRIDLQVGPGEAVAIVGRSGSGKSTLINLIAGIDRASEGEICVSGASLHSLKESALGAWRGRSLGIVFQFFQLLPSLTVLENILLPMDFTHAIPVAGRHARAMDLLETLGVGDQANKFPLQLSGGQQQRAAVARALANDPPVVVADEPTGNLDSRTAADVMTLLIGLARKGRTVLVATHEQDLLSLFSRVITLRDGRIESDLPAVANA